MDDPEREMRDLVGCKRLITAILYPEAYKALCDLEKNPSEITEVRFERELSKIEALRGHRAGDLK